MNSLLEAMGVLSEGGECGGPKSIREPSTSRRCATSRGRVREHWRTKNSIHDRSQRISGFLGESLPMAAFPYITWHLDPESTGNFKSFVTVGILQDSDAFQGQIAKYFNDNGPLYEFEEYRRR